MKRSVSSSSRHLNVEKHICRGLELKTFEYEVVLANPCGGFQDHLTRYMFNFNLLAETLPCHLENHPLKVYINDKPPHASSITLISHDRDMH